MKRSELTVGQVVEIQYGHQVEVLDTGTWVRRRHSYWRDDYRITAPDGTEVRHNGERRDTGKGCILTRSVGSTAGQVTRLADLRPVGTYAAEQAAAKTAREEYEAADVARRQALIDRVRDRFGDRTDAILRKYHLNRPLESMDHKDERLLEALGETTDRGEDS